MKKLKVEINYTEYESAAELAADDRSLVNTAREAALHAYAPYSGFHVGAAVLLENGIVVTGNNQENAAYPSGLCAERVALFTASAQYPDQRILALAITAQSAEFLMNTPVSPCGACRQVMAEYEMHQKHDFKILLSGQEGKVILLNNVTSVLPFIFDGSVLKKKN
jgi:cytidine deaminase